MNKEYAKKLLKMLVSYPRRIFTGISFRAIVVDSDVHKTAVLERNVNFRYSSIGRYSYISANSSAVYTKIGNFCSIASGVSIGGGAHPIDTVSTSPVFHGGHNIFHKNFCNMDFSPFKKTTIGNDVWIGNRVIVLQGVCIGDGAVIGAGSVVTKDIGPYQIWAGNPARFIRKRFSNDVIEGLEKVQWWDMYEDELNNIGSCFADPKLLISKLTKNAEEYSD